MKRFIYGCTIAAALAPSFAHAAAVYDGCAAPTVKTGRHTFFVDPVKGSKTGDGSSAKPWRTLTEVLDSANGLVATKGHNTRTFAKGDTSLVDVNPKGVIKPGDVIMLMSGNHGDVRLLNYFNPDFITVMAAPGQTPVVSSLMVVSSSKWMFQGIKFQGIQPASAGGWGRMVTAGYADWLGQTQDVVFDGNSFSATDDATSWTPQQWLSSPYYYALVMAAPCTSATNNHFYNLMNAVVVQGNNSLVQGNVIERMANDGLEIMASNLLIKGNTIRDGVNDAQVSPLHADAIQGWSLSTNGVVNTNKNVVIDSNVVMKTGSGKTSYLQGISVFDGIWDNLTISNNIVMTNTYQGINVTNAISASIVNNTVLGTDPSYGTWITAVKGKQQKSNVVVRNNIATAFQFLDKDANTNFTVDHNIAAVSLAYIRDNGLPGRYYSGSWNGTNKIIPSVMDGFVTVNSKTNSYDLRLKANSVAQAYGITDKAPLVDIVGKNRKPTVTAGAYN